MIPSVRVSVWAQSDKAAMLLLLQACQEGVPAGMHQILPDNW